MPGSPDARILAVAARQHSVFTRAQALERGFTARMIQGRLELGLWRSWHRGVYAIGGAPRTWRQDLMAACLATGGHASHRSAAALFKLLPAGHVEVVVDRGTRRSRPGVRVREARDVRPGDLATIDGIPVTSVARALVDLASVLERDEYEEVVDMALTRRLVTIERLCRRAEGVSRGHSGAARLGEVLRARGPRRPETRLERRILRILERGGFHNFQAQVWITVGHERFRLRQWKRDLRRQTLLVAAGWTFLRFSEDDLTTPDEIWARVESVLTRLDTA